MSKVAKGSFALAVNSNVTDKDLERMMNIIPTSHLALVRARKKMESAFACNDWEAVKEWDTLVSHQLNEAFDDDHRDHALLVGELEKILALYSAMTRCLPEATAQQWLRPERVL